MSETQTTPPLVLVVDDSLQTRLLARNTLANGGFQVVEANDGEQAIQIFQKTLPDIILLDVIMPGMNGFDTCSAIRALPNGKFIPILMVTGLDDVDSIHRSYDVGATDFVYKPINWLILLQRVRYMLRANTTFQESQQSKAKLEALISAMPDTMLLMDLQGKFLEIIGNTELTAWPPPDRLLQNTIDNVLSREIASRFHHAISNILKTQMPQLFVCQFDKNGITYFYEIRVTPCDSQRVLAVVRDVTKRKESEDKIRFLAFHDNLTKLPNRINLQEQLRKTLTKANHNKHKAAVLVIGLDQFKRINDTLGHQVGDQLLQAISKRLTSCTRNTDKIARIGGDEFSVLLSEIPNTQSSTLAAQRILEEISQCFRCDEHDIYLDASIGIAISPSDGTSVGQLFKNADIAMHVAKKKGGNNYQFYSSSMSQTAFKQLTLESALRHALTRNQLSLFYQPQIELDSEKIVGVEALIRWQHPELGWISPTEFIPIAEKTGLIIPIGEWVLKTACQQNALWQQQGYPPFRISVNLSSRQFSQRNLGLAVQQILQDTGLSPQYLELEITESILMNEVEETISLLQQLRKTGVRFAVDDFGTGYSSLSYLRRFPLDVLKVDRSFVKDVTSEKDSATITKTIIAMGHSLNLSVIAEGVETEDQLKFLQEQKCHIMQGYLRCRPLPADELEAFLQQNIKQHKAAS